MCGLVGFLNFDRRFQPEQAQKIVRDMAETMHHRGPDMDGYWTSEDNHCLLGHKRLNVIGPGAGAGQPMLDDSGRYVIAVDGAIYNCEELRDKLTEAGVTVRTTSDAEVLLKGYIKFGAALFPQLDGMFALAIYDTAQRTMVLVRDRAGEKPLYYRNEPGLFVFGSELQTLTRVPGLDWAISSGAMALYMLYGYVPAPQSILEGVRKLKPGCMLTIDGKGKTFERRYYAFEVDPESEATQEGFRQTCDRVEAAMVESLRRRLVSDVPLGVFLSSGIDSMLVSALAVRKLGAIPKTFTIAFEGDDGSEHAAARQISRHLGTQHYEHVFGIGDFDSAGQSIGGLLDEPNGDRSSVQTHLLCKFAREHVTVALSGDGGHELFGGYGRYDAMSRRFGNATHENPRAVISGYYSSALAVFGVDPIVQALPETRDAVDGELDIALPLFQHPERDVIHGLRQMDFAYYMPGAVLAKADRMSMRSSLETRTPFFHEGVLNEARTLPTQYLLNSKMAKLVLREIAGRYLPREVALLPKKSSAMPAGGFLGNVRAVQAEVNKAFETLKATRFFGGRVGALKTMCKVDNVNAVWAFIVLGQWARQFPVRL
ncbi:MAG TPA: asparagine synthase (glutamine-hydrolyzing) [Dongiaceae bacterium]|jgi:asparagine synthase (glutamine-hydrolysing)